MLLVWEHKLHDVFFIGMCDCLLEDANVFSIIMPRCTCACEAYGSCFVCVCVCVSVVRISPKLLKTKR